MQKQTVSKLKKFSTVRRCLGACRVGGVGHLRQFFSSLLSKQSGSPSHCQPPGTHFPSPHMKFPGMLHSVVKLLPGSSWLSGGEKKAKTAIHEMSSLKDETWQKEEALHGIFRTSPRQFSHGVKKTTAKGKVWNASRKPRKFWASLWPFSLGAAKKMWWVASRLACRTSSVAHKPRHFRETLSHISSGKRRRRHLSPPRSPAPRWEARRSCFVPSSAHCSTELLWLVTRLWLNT